MEFEMDSTAHLSKEDSSACQTSRPSIDGDLNLPWKVASIPAREMDLQQFEENQNPRIHFVRKCGGGAFEVVIEPSYLRELEKCQSEVNVDYDPMQLDESEKRDLGYLKAARMAQERFLCHVRHILYSKHSLEVKQAFRDIVHKKKLQTELERKILIFDISVRAATYIL